LKIIITGATGFISENLQSYFRSKNTETTPISLWEQDWREKLPQQGEALIHLVGKAHDTENASNPEEYFQVNTELTKQVFDRFLQSEIRDFIFFSSVKAVADTVEGVLLEKQEPDPKTPYGQSKLKAEEYLLAQNLPEDKRLFILRPCMIHGPGNKGNLNMLYKLVEKGIPWPLAAFENRRSFLSIDNLCFFLNKIITSEKASSGIYNLADDDALSTNELIRIIANASGKKPRLWKINQSLIKNFAGIGDKIKLPLNSERLKKLTENYIVSNHKIKQEFSIENLPVSAKEGLTKTIESFKEK